MSGFSTEQLLYPLTKGDTQGHPFHGNQWKQVETGDNQDPHTQTFAQNLKEFYDAGGKVERIENPNKMLDVYHEALALRETPEYRNMDDRHKQGVRFLGEASLHAHVDYTASTGEINPHEVSSSYLLVARDAQGNLVSAVNASIRDGYHLDEAEKMISNDAPATKVVVIGYLGSTGTMAGAATSLMEQAIQIASENKIPVVYETTTDSQPYHEMLGAENFGRGLHGFTTAQSQQIAKLPNPAPTIIKFSTKALLYPLTKGDKAGHDFHGNQYREVGGEGNTTRPPVGKFQLSPKEIALVAKTLKNDIDKMGFDKARDKAAVSISKILGMDKPATVGTGKGEPDYYRGCNVAGAESLLQPLEMYGNGGGAALGSGVYITSDKVTAGVYAQGTVTQVYEPSDRRVVSVWVDPSANMTIGNEVRDNTWFNYQKTMSDYEKETQLTLGERTALDDFACSPSGMALLNGYQGVKCENSTVILDRSIMKVAF